MTAVPVYAGVVVSDLDQSIAWYEGLLDCKEIDRGQGWVLLGFANGSVIELFEGDPARPGATFPSYGSLEGSPVLPGYAVDDPEALSGGLKVARQLPEWVVVVAPDGLRIVLSVRDGDGRSGLVGFRYLSPEPDAQRAFFGSIDVTDEVEAGPLAAVPVIAADRDAEMADPDGTRITLVRRSPGQ
jgi:catechol 2,3-dioxygenase-like lactoylglutathione lyase family enzyme